MYEVLSPSWLVLLLVIIHHRVEPHSLLQYCTLPCRTSSSNMPTVQYSTVRYSYSMCSDGGSTGGCPPWLHENIGGSKGGFPPWLNENMGGPQGGFPPGLIAAQPATVLYSTVQYCLPSAGGPSDRIFSSRVLEKFRTVQYSNIGGYSNGRATPVEIRLPPAKQYSTVALPRMT